MTQHATIVTVENERNSLRVDWDEVSNWDTIAWAVLNFYCKAPVTDWKLEKADPSTYLSGNSVSGSRLFISDSESLHLKLLKAPDSESVYLSKVKKKYPRLLCDEAVLVPEVIDLVSSRTGDVLFYLHVTPWMAHNGTLAEIIIMMWMSRRHVELERLLEEFGQFLKAFHTKYPGLHHNDMNPSNVLLVKLPCSFVLVDCAGLDDEVGDDYNSFSLSMDVLAEGGFGDEFRTLALAAFSRGYNSE